MLYPLLALLISTEQVGCVSSPTAYIINHTHWDREWFLTAEYTSQWIPGLIDSLERLVAENSQFRFILDGQTLVIEDLLKVAPEYTERAQKLIRSGSLVIGPYYCQPDWQLTSGELLVRNFALGMHDVEQHGGAQASGWLVDTFGHISQAPQIHRLFGIDAVYVWRGVPQLEPYFNWVSPDGSRVFTINLFGGYRNLYGVSHVPEVAIERLHSEVVKLQPFYPTPDIPLFDGYDLEDNPEDPIQFYSQLDSGRLAIALKETTPLEFANTIKGKGLDLPSLYGELNSGKYGATFPGTFSTRTYLKIMASDCDRLLFQVCEPLAVLARQRGRAYPSAQYEAWSRLLLQNAVHDCICGVSIDQVHEKMELSYRQVFDAMLDDMEASLYAIMKDCAAGDHAVSTNPMPSESWQIANNQVIHARTDGIGVWPVIDSATLERIDVSAEGFTWRNEHYSAAVRADGAVQVGNALLGMLIVSAEHGDTYSDERGAQLGRLIPISPPVLELRSSQYSVIRWDAEWQGAQSGVRATVRLHFDPSPLIRWQVDLDSRGADLRVEMAFVTGQAGTLSAGMPFDTVQRAPADVDLLPRQLPDDLAAVLLGQRELNAVGSFPFHDFVSIDNDQSTTAVLARGLRAYRVEAPGTIILVLRRSVEWLTKPNLQNRIGDAGPFFYVPDARCERPEQHEIAVAFGPAGWVDSSAFLGLVATYKNPPTLVRTPGSGDTMAWQFLREDAPLSSLYLHNNTVMARLYNPTSHSIRLRQSYPQHDMSGNNAAEVEEIAPKQILCVQHREQVSSPSATEESGRLAPLIRPRWRVGENASLPNPAILVQLEEKIASLEAQTADIDEQLEGASDTQRLHLQHRSYVLMRESAELQLTLELNRRKLAQQGEPIYGDLLVPDSEIAEIGFRLNQLRIKRRIFDYVVQVRRED